MSVLSDSRVLSPGERPSVSTPKAAKSGYRPEIEGLRAIAVLLVAFYHIWFGKVSGGVDVFLLLTGFLITGSLVRAMERGDGLRVRAFWSRLAKRLFPAAAVVLLGVLLAAFLWFPRSRWSDVISEVVASALYYVNWHLAFGAVDYMAENNQASPVQHFWSLAIQGQFYLLWPAFLAVAGFLAVQFGRSLKPFVIGVVAVVFVTSFAYSLMVTRADSTWAYFDGAARLWELALGGLLALTVSRIRLPERLRIVFGWVGLISLVLCGALVPVSLPYPGFIALWPTGAAVLIILAGATGSPFAADRLLTWKPLITIGGLSYSLFLWHWPVLVFYLEVTERVRPSLVGGLYVLALSFVLAILTKKLVEGGAEKLASVRPSPGASLGAGALFLVPVLIVAVIWNADLDRRQAEREALASNVQHYPGAMVLLDGALADSLVPMPVLPDTADARSESLERIYECHARIHETELVSCEFGPQDAERTMVLAGSSHAVMWMEGLREVAENNGWRLVTMTKDICQFTGAVSMNRDEVYTECEEWKVEQMESIVELRPDAVFTISTRTQTSPNEEYVPDGYVERWRELDELGIDVIAVRDTPRLDFLAPDCVDRNGPEGCATDRAYGSAETSPALDVEGIPANVHHIDVNDHLCPDGSCSAVIGNQLAYYDNSHFTTVFSRSMAGLIERELEEIGW